MVLFVLLLIGGVFFVKLSDIVQGFTDLLWHVLIQVLYVVIRILLTQSDEMLSVLLIYVVLKPRQVKLIVAEADQVKQRFNVVDRERLSLHVEFAHRCEHRIAFQEYHFIFTSCLNPLGKSKINQVKVALIEADVIQLEVPVTESDSMQAV